MNRFIEMSQYGAEMFFRYGKGSAGGKNGNPDNKGKVLSLDERMQRAMAGFDLDPKSALGRQISQANIDPLLAAQVLGICAAFDDAPMTIGSLVGATNKPDGWVKTKVGMNPQALKCNPPIPLPAVARVIFEARFTAGSISPAEQKQRDKAIEKAATLYEHQRQQNGQPTARR